MIFFIFFTAFFIHGDGEIYNGDNNDEGEALGDDKSEISRMCHGEGKERERERKKDSFLHGQICKDKVVILYPLR